MAERLALAHTCVAILEPSGHSETSGKLSEVPATILVPQVRSMLEVVKFCSGTKQRVEHQQMSGGSLDTRAGPCCITWVTPRPALCPPLAYLGAGKIDAIVSAIKLK